MLLAGLAGSLIAPLVAARLRLVGGALCALVPAALFVFFLTQVGAVGIAAVVDVVPWVPSLGIDLAFRLDGFSLLFALLITGIGTLVTLYAAAYMDSKPPFDRALFLFYILLFMSAMLATVLSDNLVALFVFWEMTSLLSFLLVGFDSEKLPARKAALQSLLVTAGGGLVLLAGIILIGITAGTFSISAILADVTLISESAAFPAIIVLVMIGAFTKSAQVPFGPYTKFPIVPTLAVQRRPWRLQIRTAPPAGSLRR
jgi:multicomponent Na+:H+ antiporter subunit A